MRSIDSAQKTAVLRALYVYGKCYSLKLEA